MQQSRISTFLLSLLYSRDWGSSILISYPLLQLEEVGDTVWGHELSTEVCWWVSGKLLLALEKR